MDYFDRGPPPPAYLAWWKPPSSYFPPRGEAPPSYEMAIASTSNCLPSAFINVYNNNNIASNTNSTIVVPASTDTTNGILTTSLSNNVPGSEVTNANINNNTASATTPTVSQNFPPELDQNQIRVNCQASGSGESVTNNIAKESQGNKKASSTSIKKERSVQGQRNSHHEQQAGPSSRLNETEHLRNAGSVVPIISDLRFPLRGFINPPSVPPPYDEYGRDYFRHSLTLPRRADFVDRASEYCRDEGFRRNQQQRFSLQFNVADWSSASSSTLSLSTPNSPNDLCRPPSLSSSSSSNVSHTHV